VSKDAALPLWLFVSYGGGHVKALLPVARRVRELGIAQPLYLALTTAAPIVREAGITTIGFADLMTDADGAARRKGEELASALAVRSADEAESVAYLGLSYADLERREGATQAAALYAEYGRQAFLPLSVMDRALRRFQPSLVVATNSPRAEQAALQMAPVLGIPSVCLVDLLGIWERDRLAAPGYANAVCVLNPSVRDSLIERGRPAGDVWVTGNPAFDTVLDPALIAAGATLRQEAGWDGLHVCLYASSPEPAAYPGLLQRGDPEFPRRIERPLLDAVIANPSLALWVRRHPSEPAASEIAALGHTRIRVSPAEMSLHACIHASDEVLVTVSTVGVEANMAGKYVTQVRGSMFDNLSPYFAMGIAQRELTLEQLAAGYEPPRVAAAVRERQSNGTATDRVVEVLKSVHARHGH
jgi:hypothetical protein